MTCCLCLCYLQHYLLKLLRQHFLRQKNKNKISISTILGTKKQKQISFRVHIKYTINILNVIEFQLLELFCDMDIFEIISMMCNYSVICIFVLRTIFNIEEKKGKYVINILNRKKCHTLTDKI